MFIFQPEENNKQNPNTVKICFATAQEPAIILRTLMLEINTFLEFQLSRFPDSIDLQNNVYKQTHFYSLARGKQQTKFQHGRDMFLC